MSRYSIRDFLEIRSAAAAGFSADASKVLVHSNLPGTVQVYRVPREGGELFQITDLPEPVAGAYLPTSDDVILQLDEGGNERYQIYRVPDDGGDPAPVVSDPEHRNQVGGLTRDGKTLAYISNRRNGVDFDVFVRDLATGEERCAFERGGWCFATGFSPDGRFLTIGRPTDRSMDYQAFLVDLATGDVREIAPHDDQSAFGAPQWLPDGSGFYFATEVGREFGCIARYDMGSGEWRPVIERDGDLDCRIDWRGSRLVVGVEEEGYRRIEVFDPATLEPRGEVPLPGRGIADGRLSHDGSLFAYTFVSPKESGDVWVHEFDTGETRRLTTSPNPVAPETFVEPTLHRFSSFDGESIPVFLLRPPGARPDRPCPVVVWIHGGPEGQSRPSFNPIVQYLVHRGYAVAVPNVRGSTGYGKRFHHLDDKRKRLDSVRDLEALHAWLRTVPEVDASRAALMGGSYGGFMVLAGLAFQPDLWAAGVDIVGISSWVTFLENTAPYRRKVREREYGTLEDDRAFLREISPLTHVDRMRAPLLIIHGTNDPRVPLGEAQQIHGALARKGIPTELLVYADEGHGLAKLANRLDAYPKAVDFLDRVLQPAATGTV